MTLDEFVKKYEGEKVDYDKAFSNQCVDLYRQYQVDVLEIKEHTGAVVGAKDLYINFEKMPLMQKYYTKVHTPHKGDIVIFGNSDTNKYGHVAIVLYATNKTIVVYEQDGFKQELGAKIALWTYDRVLGFLRRK